MADSMTAQACPIVEVTNVSFAYDSTPVLEDISLAVAPGSVLAVLGGNGAGKSTLLKLMLGLLPLQSGRIRIDGVDVAAQPDEARRHIAYIPESVAVYPQLTGLENLRYFLELAGHRKLEDARLLAALEEAGLTAADGRARASTYSKGMRQKLIVALALAREVPLLLLDEPASGLDPVATAELSRLIRRLAASGVATVMVTHDLIAVAEVADELCFLRAGRLQQDRQLPEAARQDVATLRSLYLDAAEQA